MTAVSQQLMQGKRTMTADDTADQILRAQQAQALADRSEGFFRDVLMWLNRERQARRDAADREDRAAQEATRRLQALDTALEKIAARKFGPGVQRL